MWSLESRYDVVTLLPENRSWGKVHSISNQSQESKQTTVPSPPGRKKMICNVEVSSLQNLEVTLRSQSFTHIGIHTHSPGKNTRVGCHSLLQGIFPNQGLNLGLLHCRQILYHLFIYFCSDEDQSRSKFKI